MAAQFQGTDAFLNGRLKGTVDGHYFAGGFHLRSGAAVAVGELVERPAGNLDHAVIQGRLKGGFGAPGDGVGDFVQPASDGNLGGHPGDGVAGGLAGQGRTAADAGVDFDDIVGRIGLPGQADGRRHPGMRLQGELHIATALDAQPANDLQAGRPQHLILFVGEGLAGGDYDAVAGMDAHRVEVFHIADGDAVVGAVAHYLILDFLPAHQRAFQQDLGNGAGGQAGFGDGLEFFRGVGDAAAAAAQGVGRADDQRQAQPAGRLPRLFQRVDGDILRFRLADFVQEVAEEFPVFRTADGFQRRPQQPHGVAFQHPGVGQGHRQVEAGLPAQGRQKAVGPLPPDNPFQHFHGQRLDVDAVGNALVGHDGGRVGVDEDGLHALLAQRLAGLGAGVVKLGGLPDDDGAGADDQDFLRASVGRIAVLRIAVLRVLAWLVS